MFELWYSNYDTSYNTEEFISKFDDFSELVNYLEKRENKGKITEYQVIFNDEDKASEIIIKKFDYKNVNDDGYYYIEIM